MRYFYISNGLRGCYMADSIWCGAFKTRRDLKAALEDQCGYDDDAPNKRAIASLAAAAWRAWPKGWDLDMVAPYKTASYGLFVGHATRREYLEFRQQSTDY